MAKSFSKAKKDYNESFYFFANYLTVEYETLCTTQYALGNENAVVFNGNNKLHAIANTIHINSKQDSLELLNDLIKIEDREVQAMIEALAARDKFESLRLRAIENKSKETQELQNVAAGRTTLKSMIGSITQKSKETQTQNLTKSISSFQKHVDEVTLLHEMITLIIANHEINKFKSDKLQKYHEIIQKIAGMQVGSAKNFEDYWTIVLENDNVKKTM